MTRRPRWGRSRPCPPSGLRRLAERLGREPPAGKCNAVSTGGDLSREMRRLPYHHLVTDPLDLDTATAERLLSGTLAAADAPPAYAGVARVLQAAAAPASPAELAGELETVAAMAAARSTPGPLVAVRRRSMLGSLTGGKALAAVAAALLSTGGVAAAATGSLPAPAQHAVHSMLGHAGIHVPGPNHHAKNHPNHHATGHHSRATPTGPDATGPAKHGLCQAWSSGQGGTHGNKNDAVAFQALAKAAGGQSEIADYCKPSLAGHEPDDAGDHGKPSLAGQHGRPSAAHGPHGHQH